VVSEYNCYTHSLADVHVCVCIVVYWTWWSGRVPERYRSSCVRLRLSQPATQRQKHSVWRQADSTSSQWSILSVSQL